MKQIRLLLLLFATCAGLTWSAAVAQPTEPPPTAAEPGHAPDAANAAPEDKSAAATPAPADAEAAPEAEATPAESETPAEAERAEKPGALREIGASAPEAPRPPRPERGRSHSREIVSFGGSHLLPGETAEAVVSILGSSLAEGPVHGAVVSILGNSEACEDVGEAVVAVLGNSIARKEVGQDVVAVLGDAEVDGHVHGQVVSVLGQIRLGPHAQVDGQVVSVGSQIVRAPGSVINGQVTEVPFLRHLPGLGTLGTWFQDTVLKARLLSWNPRVLWPWGVAFAFLGLYLLLSLVFEKPVRACIETLEERPGRTILASFLTLILTPPLFVILSFTLLGGVALVLALFIGTLFGKAAFFGFLGRRLTKPFGPVNLAVAVLVGGLLSLLLYTVPVFGLLLWKLGSMLGLGMAVYTTILGLRRDKPAPVYPLAAGAPSAPAATVPPPTSPGATASADTAAAPDVSAAPRATPGFGVPPVPPPGVAAPVPPPPAFVPPAVASSSLERAGFWRRFCASMLDLILVGVMAGLLHINGGFVLLFAVYHVVMWSLKGTTVGGIILGIQVVRLDDRKLDWMVALVRALGAFLSLALIGLGFIWVAFDDQRQSWHDKIAGTTIVRVPKGVSLV